MASSRARLARDGNLESLDHGPSRSNLLDGGDSDIFARMKRVSISGDHLAFKGSWVWEDKGR